MMDSLTKISKYRLLELNEEVNNEKEEMDRLDKIKNKKSDDFGFEEKNYNFNYNNYNFTAEKNKFLNKNCYTPNRYENDNIYGDSLVGSSIYDLKMRNKSTESIHNKTPEFNYGRISKESRLEKTNDRERDRTTASLTSVTSKSPPRRDYLKNLQRENYEYNSLNNYEKHSDNMKLVRIFLIIFD
jgi:hypothetical protein